MMFLIHHRNRTMMDIGENNLFRWRLDDLYCVHVDSDELWSLAVKVQEGRRQLLTPPQPCDWTAVVTAFSPNFNKLYRLRLTGTWTPTYCMWEQTQPLSHWTNAWKQWGDEETTPGRRLEVMWPTTSSSYFIIMQRTEDHMFHRVWFWGELSL